MVAGVDGAWPIRFVSSTMRVTTTGNAQFLQPLKAVRYPYIGASGTPIELFLSGIRHWSLETASRVRNQPPPPFRTRLLMQLRDGTLTSIGVRHSSLVYEIWRPQFRRLNSHIKYDARLADGEGEHSLLSTFGQQSQI